MQRWKCENDGNLLQKQVPYQVEVEKTRKEKRPVVKDGEVVLDDGKEVMEEYEIKYREMETRTRSEPMIVEAANKGEAKAMFKAVHGVPPTRNGGRKKRFTRKRLPVRFRVRLASFGTTLSY